MCVFSELAGPLEGSAFLDVLQDLRITGFEADDQ